MVDQNGAPVGGATVRFSLLRGSDFGLATTAEDGSFNARAMSGGGEYGYQVAINEGGLNLPPAEGRRFLPIAVRDGQTHITNLRIAVRYERLSIAGRVLASNGEPVPDAVVRVAPKSGRTWSVTATRSDVAGAFAIRALPAGNYRLWASAARSTQSFDDVAAGRTDVVVRFVATGGIEGTLAQFTERPDLSAFREDASMRYRGIVAGNTFSFRDLPPGTYHVMATSPSGSAGTKATVSAGAATKVALSNPGVGVIEGRVVDENGRPAARVRCESSNSSLDATSDAAGRFRLAGVAQGKNEVGCYTVGRHSWAEVDVVVNQTAHVELILKQTVPQRPESYAGVDFEEQLEEILVKSIVAGGPAARAGLLVGDVVLKIEGRDADRWDLARVVSHGVIGSTVRLTIVRADKERVISIVLEAAP